jgi:hypothetical protein
MAEFERNVTVISERTKAGIQSFCALRSIAAYWNYEPLMDHQTPLP